MRRLRHALAEPLMPADAKACGANELGMLYYELVERVQRNSWCEGDAKRIFEELERVAIACVELDVDAHTLARCRRRAVALLSLHHGTFIVRCRVPPDIAGRSCYVGTIFSAFIERVRDDHSPFTCTLDNGSPCACCALNPYGFF